MATTVELAREPGGVARVTFRSENGIQILSAETRRQFQEVLGEIESAGTDRVVVFAAEGRTFLAGADLHELRGLTPATARKYAREGQRMMQRVAELPAATVIAIHAACVGGGCELALACDYRLASASARIGLPEVTLGLIPGWGGTARATCVLGSARARRIVLSGELLDAETARSTGLVDLVVADEQFREAVEAHVRKLLRAAPRAVATAKRIVGEDRELQRLLREEARQFAECYATGEAAEGISAFLEKRSADWEGVAGPARRSSGRKSSGGKKERGVSKAKRRSKRQL